MNPLLLLGILVALILGGDGGVVLLHKWVERTKEQAEMPSRAGSRPRVLGLGLARRWRTPVQCSPAPFLDSRTGAESGPPSRGPRAGSVSNPAGRS